MLGECQDFAELNVAATNLIFTGPRVVRRIEYSTVLGGRGGSSGRRLTSERSGYKQ